MKKLINWLHERPNSTRLEISTGVFIGTLIAAALTDLFK